MSTALVMKRSMIGDETDDETAQEALANAVCSGIPGCLFCWRQQPDSDYTSWSIVQDTSLLPPPSPPLSVGIELVSGILNDGTGDQRFVVKERSAWMTEIDAVGRAIAALGTAKDAIEICGGQGTGFHIHVGIHNTGNNNTYTLEDLQKIVIVVLHYEGQIDKLHPPHRREADDPYIFSNTLAISVTSGHTVQDILGAILQYDNIPDLIQLFNPPRPGHNDDPARACRYYKYNFASLSTLGTIEFRSSEDQGDHCVLSDLRQVVLGAPAALAGQR
ncbi:hypothetical protein CPB85DRAFT_1563608 [Mucidula mucida]|nr:hypothetical protein CPB85DRAFT_1563608 [Mucidula mucida]